MEQIERQQFVGSLDRDWSQFVPRFRALDAAGQQAYLQRQGYSSLGALLAHIIAWWWMDGQQVVEAMRGDANMALPHYDVDSFNARAVEKFSSADEEAMVELFEAQRMAMLSLVLSLADNELLQANINTRLYYELILHWKEHEQAILPCLSP